jgi:hypothetical protein
LKNILDSGWRVPLKSSPKSNPSRENINRDNGKNKPDDTYNYASDGGGPPLDDYTANHTQRSALV